MRDETKAWLGQAAEDLDTAEFLLQAGRHEAAALFAQQCAEKALKGHSIETSSSFKRTHDLVRLGRDAGLPQNMVQGCSALSAAYTATRYPDAPGRPTAERAERLVETAKEVLEWVRSQVP